MTTRNQSGDKGGRKVTRRDFLRYSAMGGGVALFLSACAPAAAPTGGAAEGIRRWGS